MVSPEGALTFSGEALRLVRSYVSEFEARLSEVAPRLDLTYKEVLREDLEHEIRFRSARRAFGRGRAHVTPEDVSEVLRKLGRPERLVRERCGSPDEFERRHGLARRYLAAVCDLLRSVERPRVLDAGCGWGRQLLRVLRLCPPRAYLVGIDVDACSLVYGSRALKGVQYALGSVEGRLPFREGSFHVVVCTAVLHETRQGDGGRLVIEEFARVLKPDGLLYLADTFSKTRFQARFMQVFRRMFKERFYDEGYVRAALEKCGFEVLERAVLRTTALYRAVAILAAKRR